MKKPRWNPQVLRDEDWTDQMSVGWRCLLIRAPRHPPGEP